MEELRERYFGPSFELQSHDKVSAHISLEIDEGNHLVDLVKFFFVMNTEGMGLWESKNLVFRSVVSLNEHFFEWKEYWFYNFKPATRSSNAHLQSN